MHFLRYFIGAFYINRICYLSKPKMPSNRAVSLEELQNVFLNMKADIYDDAKKKIFGPSNKCWSTIAEKLKNKITPKYAYTIALQNRNNILDFIGIIGSNTEYKQEDSKNFDDEYEGILHLKCYIFRDGQNRLF